MKITRKESLGIQPVYDIGVSSPSGNNNFILKNKIVASNCFNKAHSISYSFLTYISAYLKTHYPVEFFAALMSTRSKTLQPKSWAVKAHEYITEAKEFNVNVLPPSINKSSFDFTIAGNEIYFGFNAIRDVGKTAAKSIMSARRSTPFKDIKDFLNRVNLQKVNTKTFEALIKAGAFDSLGYNRTNLLNNTSSIYSYIKDIEDYKQRQLDILERDAHNAKVAPIIERRTFLRKEVKKLQNKYDKNKASSEDIVNLGIYSEELNAIEEQPIKKLPALKPKELPEFPDLIRNQYIELTLKEVLEQAHYIGCYIGGHPINMLDISRVNIDSLVKGTKAKIAGVVVGYKSIVTRTGKKMAFFEVDDATSSAEVVLFPSLYQKYSHLEINEGDILVLNVRVDSTDPQIKLIPNDISKYRIQDEMDT